MDTERPSTPFPDGKILEKFCDDEHLLGPAIEEHSLTPLDLSRYLDMCLDDTVLTHEEKLNFILELREQEPLAVTQSASVEQTSTEDTSLEMEENITFADEPEQVDLTVGMMSSDPTFSQGVQEGAELGNFLSRPVEILRQNWAVGAVTPFLTVFNPWELFLNNAKVLNKLQTFKLLHGTLKMKIVVNGSPFHYGRAFVGVRPTRFDNNTSNVDMTTNQLSLTFYTDYGTPGPKSMRSFNTLYSSRPHVFVDPTTNQPNHIDWPFFAGTSWIDLQDADSTDRMGRVEFWELTQLRHANNGTDPVTVSFFAWMEDVTLTGLTIADAVVQSGEVPAPKKSTATGGKKKGKKQAKLANNAGKTNDEYNKGGAISAPASIVATAAGYFTDIPYIGRFAKATQMAAGTVGDIARLFGFARPPQIEDPTLVRPQAMGSMAYTLGGDPLYKLTLDPKQELTVDPSTVGLPGDDQMSFGYVAKKEAWIDVIPWAQVVLPDRKLYAILVHPRVAPIDDLANDRFHQTPLSFVTRPFQYWSGSLRYRFQIVCSNFHRGRLLVQYDPTGQNSATPDFNSRYSQIIDITQDRDFTIEVKWSQPQAYGELFLNEGRWATIGPLGVINNDIGTNGIIELYVINELASPIDDADIDINVFISAGDDFEVRAPNAELTQFAYARNDVTVGPPATTQSGFVPVAVVQSAQVTVEENAPDQDTTYLINGSYCGCDPTKSNVYFGESVVSIRSLLKRYTAYRPLVTTGLTASTITSVDFTQFNFPNGPGPSYGSSIASDLTPIGGGAYNICNLTYLRFFMQAYIGWRGGIKWKVVLNDNSASFGVIKVARNPARINGEQVNNIVMRGTGTSILNTAKRYLLDGANDSMLAGGQVNSESVNSSLEYEVPLYAPYRYVETNEPFIGAVADRERYQSHYNGGGHYLAYVSAIETIENPLYFETYVAAGEDFSLFFFIGAPPFYNTDAPDVV